MKNRKRIICIIITLILIILLTTIYLFFYRENYIEYKVLETKDNINSRCKTIFLETEGDKYSFDNGITWQKSNYYVVCDNKKYDVIIKDNSKNVISKGKIKINGLRKDGPKININFDKIEKYKEKINLLNGVTAIDDNNKDITNNITYKVIEENNNYILLEYKIKDENRLTTSVARKIEKEKNIDKENETSISFEKTYYLCKENDEIHTTINVNGNNIDGTQSTIREFSSSNDNIAIIKKYSGNNPKKCDNCLNVIIECKEEGKAKLYAESSTDANVTIEIFVQ